jgi:TolB-like protein/tetratricopeptide (TPR) repeat protein/tRNA A-37 threonylcarbamoyl transferase component Bud32
MPDLLDRITSALADRYAVKAEIGRGGMATVFLAEDLKHHRKVAVKVLHPELAAAVGPERFLREIDTVAALDHPHILPLYDSGEACGVLYYIMPFVEGESLRDRMAREKQLGVEEAVRVALEIADALAYAHEHGVIHRDIKPENVLLSDGHARVTDFGVARAITEAGEGRVTATGMAVGTPAYMSPEQGAGDEADERSDIYALGCVLYEMLSGDVPLLAPTPQAVHARRISEAPPSLRVMRDTVPEPLDQAVGKALARLPADRWESAQRFGEALIPWSSAATVPQTAPARSQLRRRAVMAGVLASVGIATIVVLTRALLTPRGGETPPVPRLVVLPFENLGAAEDEYFADGITEEITARLAGLPTLAVISRQSAMQYKRSTKLLTEIGSELGAHYVLEGTIRWSRDSARNRVRVTPQLIKVDDDTHIWANIYDEDLTEVFSVQSAIARHVAEALGVVLDKGSTGALARVPTDNLEAYDIYLRAQPFFDQTYAESALQQARSLYSQAIELDPEFADAYAMLGYSDLKIYWFGYDKRQERLEEAKRAIDRAMALSGGSSRARLALGYYHYWGFRDYDEALRQFTLARQERPNDLQLIQGFAYVYRRQGRMHDARAVMEQSLSLNPRSATEAYNLAETSHLLRDFPTAIQMLELASQLQPEFGWPPFELLAVLVGTGDIPKAREVVRQATAYQAPPGWPQRYWWSSGALYRILGVDYERALERIARMPFGGDTALQLLTEKRFAEALRYLDAAVAEQPVAARLHGQLALAHVGMGQPALALRAARRAVEVMPIERDAFDGPEAAANLAMVLAIAGDVTGAIEQLEVLLSAPGRLTVEWLIADPAWDPIRDDPQFQRLLAKHATPGVPR